MAIGQPISKTGGGPERDEIDRLILKATFNRVSVTALAPAAVNAPNGAIGHRNIVDFVWVGCPLGVEEGHILSICYFVCSYVITIVNATQPGCVCTIVQIADKDRVDADPRIHGRGDIQYQRK